MKLQNQDMLKMSGELHVVVRDDLGIIKQEFTVPNLIVTAGKEYIASRMTGTSSAIMSHMAIGTGVTAPVVSNTTLQAEAARVGLTTFTTSTNQVTSTATFPANVPSSGLAMTEAGIFNASTAGTMLCRTTFPVVNKSAGDSITISWVVTVS